MHQAIQSQTAGKKILLIGSSGNIGSRALKLLVNHGKAASISAFDKNPSREKDLPEYVKVLSGDRTDITSPFTRKIWRKSSLPPLVISGQETK